MTTKTIKKSAEWEKLWNLWVKIFKNGPSKICGRQPLKNLKWYGLPKQNTLTPMFLNFSHSATFLIVLVAI